MFSVIQKAVWLCQKYECLQMRSQEPRTATLAPSSKTVLSRGAVVNIASVAGMIGMGQPGYAAAKAAVQSITRTGSQFYGPYNIRVNTVSPGAIMSDGFHAWLPTLSADMRAYVENEIMGRPPARRMGQPEELAAAANWLLSDESTFMHGSNIICDGGFSATTYSANPDA
jgi:NAD(P)-dependent dehydrogenase (short-subunit alcohol dehydrogenase family)